MSDKRFIIIEHDLEDKPTMTLVDEAKASSRFDLSDCIEGNFTVLALHDDGKLHEVYLSDERENCRNEGSIVYAISEMVIEDRHTFGRAVVGHVQHTDH